MSNKLIRNAITTACSAALSALTLSLEPIYRAIEAVTPLPKPKDKPITKKKIGKLNATAAIASPPNLPMNSMSTILYNVCIPIPAMIGIAKYHNDFEGLSINDCKREWRFLDSSISAEFILENFYDSALFNKAKMAK